MTKKRVGRGMILLRVGMKEDRDGKVGRGVVWGMIGRG